MKRLHVAVSVDDLDRSIAFYAMLFGVAPSVRKDDYAKWMLDDPRVNFAISARGRRAGLDHLGIQAETNDELSDIAGRLAAAGESLFEQQQTVCCYARSDKAWVTDPSGIAWESFVTHGAATVYGEDVDVNVGKAGSESCCAPGADATTAASCCGGA
jgi:catechol 2,3-dioxygenase-like lactoylglutathione lyase family enzyme